MILYPAIDILEGRAVRLLHGKRENVTDYGDPLDRAKGWIDCGAQILHVVDLSGAFGASGGFLRILEKIAGLGVPVQTGGGMRSAREIEARFSAGASYAVLGTVCVKDPALFSASLEKYGEKIVVGMDAKAGKLAVGGWTETTDVDAFAFGKEAYRMGATRAVFTDIGRDGALSGVNLEETIRMRGTGLQVIASGGIRNSDDLYALEKAGVYGAILGRSIYTGDIDFQKAAEVFRC